MLHPTHTHTHHTPTRLSPNPMGPQSPPESASLTRASDSTLNIPTNPLHTQMHIIPPRREQGAPGWAGAGAVPQHGDCVHINQCVYVCSCMGSACRLSVRPAACMISWSVFPFSWGSSAVLIFMCVRVCVYPCMCFLQNWPCWQINEPCIMYHPNCIIRVNVSRRHTQNLQCACTALIPLPLCRSLARQSNGLVTCYML